MAERMKPLPFDDAKILPGLFRNFSGRETKFSAAGNKTFCMALSVEDAVAMRNDGWNVKYTTPKNPEDDPTPYLQIAVSYRNRPPRIMLITSGGKTELDEVSCSTLDWADILRCDLVINPSQWDNPNPNGSNIKAYLRSMYVTLDESGDPFTSKYMGMDTIGLPAEFVDED